MKFEVNEWLNRKMAGMYGLCDDWANTLRDKAKTNAKWEDRTAHARQDIHGGVEGGNNEYTIYTSYGVEYGGFLEEGTGIYGPKEKSFKVATKNGKSYWHNGMKGFHTIQNTMLNSKERIRNTVIEWWSD